MLFELLLYVDLKCTDAAVMLDRIESNEYLDNATSVELIEVIEKQLHIVHGTQTTEGTGKRIPYESREG